MINHNQKEFLLDIQRLGVTMLQEVVSRVFSVNLQEEQKIVEVV